MSTLATLETTTARQLDELLAEAHASTYRFPADFAGFTATLAVVGSGWHGLGTTTVRGPASVEVAIDAPEDELGWVAKELTSIVGHR